MNVVIQDYNNQQTQAMGTDSLGGSENLLMPMTKKLSTNSAGADLTYHPTNEENISQDEVVSKKS